MEEPFGGNSTLTVAARNEHLHAWVERIRRLDPALINELVAGLGEVGVLNGAEQMSLGFFLENRREALGTIVASCRAEPKGGYES